MNMTSSFFSLKVSVEIIYAIGKDLLINSARSNTSNHVILFCYAKTNIYALDGYIFFWHFSFSKQEGFGDASNISFLRS